MNPIVYRNVNWEFEALVRATLIVLLTAAWLVYPQPASAETQPVVVKGNMASSLANEAFGFCRPTPCTDSEVVPFSDGTHVDFDAAYIVSYDRGSEFGLVLPDGLYFAAYSGLEIQTGLVGVTSEGTLDQVFMALISRNPIESIPMTAYAQNTASPFLDEIGNVCSPENGCTGSTVEFVLNAVRADHDAQSCVYDVPEDTIYAYPVEGGGWLFSSGPDTPNHCGVIWFFQS